MSNAFPSDSPEKPRDLGPGVRFPPPILFAGGIALGLLLDRWVGSPLRFASPLWMEILGVLLVVGGCAVMYTALLTFKKFRTAVYPNRPAKLVVDTGIYARTRNPMYLGMTIAYCGFVFMLSSLWTLALLPLVHVVLFNAVISREERHLRERFPTEYSAYCARVPRWW